MLKVLFFYLFAFWFVKLENRKALTARAVISLIVSLICTATAISIFIKEAYDGNGGLAMIGIIPLIVAILLFIRFWTDIPLTVNDSVEISNSSKTIIEDKKAVEPQERKWLTVDEFLFEEQQAARGKTSKMTTKEVGNNISNTYANERKSIEEAKKRKEREELEEKMRVYDELIEQCGAKFFIKYYYRIKRLRLRDVEVTENYSSQERMERLTAAKKIIDSGLTEFALNQILISYCDMLEEIEIATANKILSELNGDAEAKC